MLALLLGGSLFHLPLVYGQTENISQNKEQQLPDMALLLELVINGKQTGQLIPVHYQAGHYYIAANLLADAGLAIESTQEQIAVDLLQGVTVDYQSSEQKLQLTVPMTWLPKQNLTNYIAEQNILAPSSNGALFNYTLYANKSSHDDTNGYISAFTEQRLFGRFGAFNNDGLYKYTVKNEQLDQKNGYIRYNTTWKYTDEKQMIRYSLGDVITGSLPWTSSVRLGGIKISRNFSSNPSLITYPLPEFSGQAAVPSTVDLYINNYKNKTLNVDPGPFSINSLPYINGAGEAVIVTKDTLGREVQITQPFYVESTLLKKGFIDFDFSAGALRKNYGISSSDYGDLALSSTIRYGLSNKLTIEGHTQMSKGLTTAGAGVTLQLGLLGVLNTSYNKSYADNNTDEANEVFSSNSKGQQTSIGYSYSRRLFSFNARRTQQSKGFKDLSSIDLNTNNRYHTDQISGSLSLGTFGSLSAGYVNVKNYDEPATRLLNISYSKSLFKNINLYMTMNKQIGEHRYSAALGLYIPLDTQSNVSLNSTRDEKNHYTHRIAYDKSVPTEGGLGWGVGYASKDQSNHDYKEANLTWKTRHFEAKAGVYGQDNHTLWAELNGSLIAMDHDIYVANKIDDSFVLVSTNGYENVPVHYENQLIGTTNHNGHLLIPDVTAYYQGKYSINSLTLPADINVPEVEQSIAIRENSGYLMRFNLTQNNAMTLTLVGEDKNFLPVGSTIQLKGSDSIEAYVGWDGIVYLNQFKSDKNDLVITWPDGTKQCHAHFSQNNAQEPLLCLENK
ncbi:fimbria/pilus outer membrane usher protein [Neisseria sp. Ec49-e6-T10]|uniref:fimbria/pilus outer membrane usher protein n=1 Tax=Neisseria sp. Ec49-e6-T10 TaxID=3140744 RepID=UPI003EBAB06D